MRGTDKILKSDFVLPGLTSGLITRNQLMSQIVLFMHAVSKRRKACGNFTNGRFKQAADLSDLPLQQITLLFNGLAIEQQQLTISEPARLLAQQIASRRRRGLLPVLQQQNQQQTANPANKQTQPEHPRPPEQQ